MEAWRTVWRNGLAPVLSTDGLAALRDALKNDDYRLTQGSTTVPPPLMSQSNLPCDGSCAIGWCGWHGEGLETVGEVEDFFARACFEADCRLGESAASRWFLHWYDDTPREEMLRELRGEVEQVLADRLRQRQQPRVRNRLATRKNLTAA